MKYFLLIESCKDACTSPAFTLSPEEQEKLPFSLLLPVLPEKTPIENTPNGSDASTEEPMCDTVDTPSLLLLSDVENALKQARDNGIPSMRLPKREFPIADTLSALALDAYETVVLYLDRTTDTDLSAVIPAEKSLAITLHGDSGSACTYRTLPAISGDTESNPVSLIKRFFAEDETPETPAVIARPEPKTPLAHTVFEWLELFALSLAAVLLVMTFFIRHSPVVGSSMYPTLHGGDVLLLTQIGFTPETGDIVIIQTNKDDLRHPLVKRVIATGGDTVRIDFETWQIYLNGILLDEPYLDATDKSEVMNLYSAQQYFTKVDDLHAIYEATVPEGHIFVLGDNRQNSKDSRDLGFIDERHVIGEVVFRLLPFSAMGDPA